MYYLDNPPTLLICHNFKKTNCGRLSGVHCIYIHVYIYMYIYIIYIYVYVYIYVYICGVQTLTACVECITCACT